MKPAVELRTAQGEVFHLGQILPVSGQIQKIEPVRNTVGDWIILCVNGTIESGIMFSEAQVVSITCVAAEDMQEFLERRTLVVSEELRQAKVEDALEDTSGLVPRRKHYINPR